MIRKYFTTHLTFPAFKIKNFDTWCSEPVPHSTTMFLAAVKAIRLKDQGKGVSGVNRGFEDFPDCFINPGRAVVSGAHLPLRWTINSGTLAPCLTNVASTTTGNIALFLPYLGFFLGLKVV